MENSGVRVRCYKKSILKRNSSTRNVARKSFFSFLKCCIISLIKKMKLFGRNYGGLSYISGGR